MHIPPLENKNHPIVDANDSRVPLNYFNIVKLKKDQSFEYIVPGYETCIVPATGTVDIEVEGINYNTIGNRIANVWDGEPEGVYIPTNTKANLTCKTGKAEIFIAAIGNPEMIKEHWIKKDAVVIDVGINRIDTKINGQLKTKLVGDVDYAQAEKKAFAITPVPGGVGPMTIACLLRNTFIAFKKKNKN